MRQCNSHSKAGGEDAGWNGCSFLVCVWRVDDKEVRSSLSHKSLLGISGEQQVLQASLKM